MRAVIPALALVLVSAPQAASAKQAPAVPEPAPSEVRIPMRDGKWLAADVLLPPGDGPFPTIFIHTPYSRRSAAAPMPGSPFERELLSRERYAYVITDWRGFFGSTEAAHGVKKLRHGQDGHDAIEWIAAQPWSNGHIGMWGHSAPGTVEYHVAAEQPAHLTCMVAGSANIGSPYEQFYTGGALNRHYLQVLESVGHMRYNPIDLVLRFPFKNRLWQIAHRKTSRAKIDLPILFITGWYDHHVDLKLSTFNELRTPEKRHAGDMKLLIGPWHHTAFGKREQGILAYPEAEGVTSQETLRFFDYHLLGERGNGWGEEPAVRFLQMGANTWEASDRWPVDTAEQAYYLRADGALAGDPAAGEPPDSFVFDPGHPVPTAGGTTIDMRHASSEALRAISLPAGPQDLREPVEAREDVLRYTTDPLPEHAGVTGTMRAELYVSSDRVDTDLAVWVADVHPDGRSVLVADGIWCLRFRESLGRPKFMSPGEVYRVEVPMTATGHTFLAGHRIRLLVSSSNAPKFEVNPNVIWRRRGRARAEIATNRIHHDAAHPSALILPIRRPPIE